MWTHTHIQQLPTAGFDAVEALSTTWGAFSAPLWQKILTVALLPIPTPELSSQQRSLSVLAVFLSNGVEDSARQTRQHTWYTITKEDEEIADVIGCCCFLESEGFNIPKPIALPPASTPVSNTSYNGFVLKLIILMAEFHALVLQYSKRTLMD